MKGLARGHEIDAGIIEGSGLGGAIYARKAIVGSEVFFAGLAHGFIRLDAKNAVAVFEKDFAEKTGA
jgi:hypothetical protein